MNNWDALRNFVPFVQFKKYENTHGGKLLLVKLKLTLLHGNFSRYLNYKNNDKSRKASHTNFE